MLNYIHKFCYLVFFFNFDLSRRRHEMIRHVSIEEILMGKLSGDSIFSNFLRTILFLLVSFRYLLVDHFNDP